VTPGVLIPHYNHGEAIGQVLAGLAGTGLPCLVVDDGSDTPHRERLAATAGRWPWVSVLWRARNGGRGAALRQGYQEAWRRGFSHVVQLDADGQHDAADVPRFAEAARRHPAALVLGAPVFDASAPWSRLYGRRLSTFWVAVETLSRVVPDALCGFRVIPLRPALTVLARGWLGDRMEFDPALVVRLVWEGTPVATLPTRVRYRTGGTSHFQPWRDNVRISAMHARLCAGMLVRLPALVRRRPVAVTA
jgi:glycosyltransferase involved in cell wall biosynthesis